MIDADIFLDLPSDKVEIAKKPGYPENPVTILDVLEEVVYVACL